MDVSVGDATLVAVDVSATVSVMVSVGSTDGSGVLTSNVIGSTAGENSEVFPCGSVAVVVIRLSANVAGNTNENWPSRSAVLDKMYLSPEPRASATKTSMIQAGQA